MKHRIVALMAIWVIMFSVYPPQTGHTQVQDSVLSEQNQILLKTYRDMVDSLKTINKRNAEKLSRLEIKQQKDKTVVIIHDTVYLSFWRSLFHFKYKKR